MFVRLANVAVCAGLLFGVDIASIGAALHGMTKEMGFDTSSMEAVVAGAKGGAVFGSLLGGALIMSRGRRTSIAVSALPFLIGPLLIFTGRGFWQLLLGRLLMGFGFGLASVATPNYLSEVVVPEKRGVVEAMYELGIATGMLLSAIANLSIEALGEEGICAFDLGCWRFQAGLVPLCFALPLTLAVMLVPESPRWLLQAKGSSSEGLFCSLQEIGRLGRHGAAERLKTIEAKSAELMLSDFEETNDDLIRLWDLKHKEAGMPLFQLGDESNADLDESEDSEPPRVRTVYLLKQTLTDAGAILCGRGPPGTGTGLALAMCAAVLNQACASTSILIYAQNLLQSVGVTEKDDQDAQTLITFGAKLLGVLLGLFVVDRVSRRLLLAVGGLACAAFMGLLMVGAMLKSASLLLLGMGCFVMVFYCTWGVGYWAVVVEVTSCGGARYSSAAQAMSTATLFGAGWLTSMTFVSVMSLGPMGLLVYMGVGVLMFCYAYCWLPETSGHSLEECAEDVTEEASASDDESDEATS